MTDENLENVLNAVINLQEVRELLRAVESKENADPLGVGNFITSNDNEKRIYNIFISELREFEACCNEELEYIFKTLISD